MHLANGEYGLFIDGKYVPAEGGATFKVVDPSTGQVAAEVAKGSEKDVDRAVQAARKAFDSGDWSRRSPEERAQVLEAIALKIGEHAEELAFLEVQSSGATLRRVMNADLLSVIELFVRCARLTREISKKEVLDAFPLPGPNQTMVVREPIGVCAAIAPFNFPLILASWKLAPALAMGNTVVLKPATYTPLTAIALGKICQEAGLPDGVLNIVPGPGGSVGEALAGHPDVDKVAFTGSTVVGRRIMQVASGTIKKVTLELGGKSPNIILDDADLDIAVPGSLFAFLLHCGQVCESGTRLFVPRKMQGEIVERMVAQAKQLKIGSAMDLSCDLGPVVSKQQMETILSYVEAGKQEGAKLVLGGKRCQPAGLEDGFYVEPTIFTDVNNKMRIAQEEIFGPVLSVIPYDTVEEAVAMANDSMYGLAGGVWSRDHAKALQVAGQIRAGTVWINDWHMLRSDAPFGGYKQSGLGRELGRWGMEAYTELKTINMSMTLERSQRGWYDRMLGLKG